MGKTKLIKWQIEHDTQHGELQYYSILITASLRIYASKVLFNRIEFDPKFDIITVIKRLDMSSDIPHTLISLIFLMFIK